MSELPKGWAGARLDELADLNPKQKFDDELAAGFVPMSHAPTNFRDKLRFDERNWGDIKKAYTNFKDGDVIFAKVTPCFENGKAALVENLPNGIGAGSSEFFVLRPSSEEISAKYLLALVKSRDFLSEGANNMTGAVGLRRVPKQFVESYVVPVPPAAEQIRHAACSKGLYFESLPTWNLTYGHVWRGQDERPSYRIKDIRSLQSSLRRTDSQ